MNEDDIARRLADTRPELSALELDQLKTRTLRSLSAGARRPVRSRLAVAFAIGAGFIFAGAGLALGAAAVHDGESAAVAQYGPHHRCQSEPDKCQGVLGISGEGGSDGGGNLQASAQLDRSGGGSSGLPFTGYLALPALAIGILSLVVGVVMRRRLVSDT